jgi:hypothetical protein
MAFDNAELVRIAIRETAGQVRVGLTLAQVGHHHQGLHAGIQPERISHAPPFQDRWQFDWSLEGVTHSQVAWIRSSAACSANGLVISL